MELSKRESCAGRVANNDSEGRQEPAGVAASVELPWGLADWWWQPAEDCCGEFVWKQVEKVHRVAQSGAISRLRMSARTETRARNVIAPERMGILYPVWGGRELGDRKAGI